MPNRPIEPRWRGLVTELAVNNPKMGAYRMRKRLEEEAPALGLNAMDVPSHRTVNRVLQEVKVMPEKEREPHLYFRWPESMEAGLLPWEAGRAALDLLRDLAQIHIGLPPDWEWDWGTLSDEQRSVLELFRRPPETTDRWRPTVRVVRWFWRVTQVIPDATIRERRSMAADLILAEAISLKEQNTASNMRRAVEVDLGEGAYRMRKRLEEEAPLISDARGLT